MSRGSNGIPARPLFVTDCDYRFKRLLWMTAISKVRAGAALSPFCYLSPMPKAINVAGKMAVIKPPGRIRFNYSVYCFQADNGK